MPAFRASPTSTARCIKLLSPTPQESREAIDWLVRQGDRSSIAVLIQLLRWLPEHRDVLEALTGAHVGPYWFDWMVWQQDHPDFPRYPGYAGFLADLLARIDPQFRRFVYDGIAHEIRMEEIAWGGVLVDGIPALDNPRMTTASAASYLNPDDSVFGVEINATPAPIRCGSRTGTVWSTTWPAVSRSASLTAHCAGPVSYLTAASRAERNLSPSARPACSIAPTN